MKKWYKSTYFDSSSWILENFNKLNLTNDEVIVLLLIDYASKNNMNLNYDYFKAKLKCDTAKIDDIVSSLVNKKYLTIVPSDNGANFNIDGLFEFDPSSYELSENKDVYEIAEELKGKPLSGSELQKISDLLNEFEANKIIDAFRTAEAYRKTSIAYVESILRNEKQ